MSKIAYIFILTLVSYNMLCGQQKNFGSRHLDYYFLSNPAATSSILYLEEQTTAFNADIFYRNQWWKSGLKGTPVNAGISASGILDEVYLLGGGFFYDGWGSLKNYQINIRGAIDLVGAYRNISRNSANQDHSLTLGVSLHAERLAIDFNKISFNVSGDPLSYDNAILNSEWQSRVSVGLFGRTRADKVIFTGGLSVSQLMNSQIRINDNIVFKEFRQAIVNGGIIFETGNRNYLEFSGTFAYLENTPIYYSGHFRFYLYKESYHSIGLGFLRNRFQIETYWAVTGNNERYYRIGVAWDFFILPKYTSSFGQSNTLEFRVAYILK